MINRRQLKNHIAAVCCCLTIFCSFTARAQQASFSADVTAGCAPLTVSFNNTSDAGATWDWDFQLGAHSTNQHASKVFTVPGTYNVRLTATYPGGTRTATQTITVYQNPVPRFSATPLSGCTPMNVQFTDASTPGSGTIRSITWDFGDGNSASGASVSHTFNVNGAFSISTIVENSFGCKEGLTLPQYIRVGSTPQIDFVSDVQTSCTTPLTVNFRSSGPGGLTYAWDFGDPVSGAANTSAAQHPAHTYANEGSYTVTLRARTPEGCENTVSKTAFVVIQRTRTDFVVDGTACIGAPTRFRNTTSPNPTLSSWTFPDGSTSSGRDASFNFTAPGTYNVTLTSGRPGCLETVTKAITVHPRPTAGFTATPRISCAAPFDVQFTSTSTGASTYQWTFGDGTTGTGPSPRHTYNNFGQFDVTLDVSNAAGCTDRLSMNDFIIAERPQAVIDVPDPEGCIPHTAAFSARLLTAGVITGYQWDFGDPASGAANTSTSPNPSHTYTNEGAYTVRLVLMVNGTCRVDLQTTARAGRIPVVEFDANPKAPCQSDPVSFTNLSQPRGTEWEWVLPEDGGMILRTENPVYRFRNLGLHDVTLTVNNYGCRRTLTKPDFIRILPPIANFGMSNPCSDKMRVTFTDLSDFGPIPGTPRFWKWEFGDGNTSTNPSPTHVYATPGTYSVRLVVTDGNCESEMTQVVDIIDERPVISAAPEVCAANPLVFSRSNVDENNIVRWEWNWGDGTYAPVGGNNIAKVFSQPGRYNVVLTVTDRNNCVTSSNVLDIQVNGSTANFAVTGRRCEGDEQTFNDASTSFHGKAIESWTWNFGDGTADEIVTTKPTNYKHAFASSGTFNVVLQVKDEAGCLTSISRPVTVRDVEAGFQAPAQVACKNTGFQFSNTSTGTNLTYAWDFGDNSSSTDRHPLKTFTTAGIYTIKLTVTDDEGCTSTETKNQFITVPDPQAKFTVPGQVAQCPPALVSPDNQSTGYARAVWEFGDNSRSSLDEPDHVYNLPGNYTITLNVYSAGDCVSTTTQDIFIEGPIGTKTITNKIGCAPHTTSFSASSPNTTKYTWDMDNGTVTTTSTNTFSYEYTQPGVYYPRVVLEDAKGCKVPAQGLPDSIVVDKATAGFTMSTLAACDEADVLFTNASTSLSAERHGDAMQYRWDFGVDGRTDDVSTDEHPRFDYTGAADYRIKLLTVTRYGCEDSAFLTLKIDPKPEAAIAPAGPVCVNETVQFSGSENRGLPATSWTWTVDGQPGNSPSLPPNLVYRQAGPHDVRLVIRNSEGTCPDTAEFRLVVNPLPSLAVTPRQALVCEGQSLQVISNGGPAQYSWTPYNISSATAENPVISPVVDTLYRVTAVNQFGCRAIDSLRIRVSHPFTVNASNAEICEGKQTRLRASGAVRYRWIPADGLNDAGLQDPVATPQATTQYRVVGYGNDACFTDTARVTVTVHQPPVITVPQTLNVPSGTVMPAPVTGSPDIITWAWYPEKWLSCYDCPQPEMQTQGPVTYQITATNVYGCQSTVLLPVKLFCSGSTAFIPNTFTPNGDGQNDIFYVRGRGVRTIKSFRVFNRWGQLVFERANCQSDDPGCGWDGRFAGQALPPDVFVYYAEIVCDSGEPMTLKGNVTLLR
ncbi:PKD domain-containing protein [Chitinophaga caseinilytica]|uniref:PKD domain-containing protein n=1 Tax=Chitinophaga caseinilytica TaxID=2267521 RepID=A0ABZ2Z4M5_9BACT